MGSGENCQTSLLLTNDWTLFTGGEWIYIRLWNRDITVIYEVYMIIIIFYRNPAEFVLDRRRFSCIASTDAFME